ncbi:hypothetical protein HNR46_002266 [Haloferula luteola]|uniref:Uncharacterized protein n=1 Tax=Haloferula luteola TaxID=595692 RepID=A0A840V209_9BACT|nr:hypothetical protein [Haloferula luteola]MBB5352025.1 hypothetical protein [Haloferula luteola]
MSALPERRKSAEELAKLRASLGIDGDAPPPPDLKHQAPPPPLARKPDGKKESPSAPAASKKAGVKKTAAKKAAKAGEPASKAARGPSAPSASAVLEAEEGRSAAQTPKVVRSLKKSEQGPIRQAKVPVANGEGALPARRHTEEELRRFRLGESNPADLPAAQLAKLTAAWWVIAPLYAVGVVGLILSFSMEQQAKTQMTGTLARLALRPNAPQWFFSPLAVGSGIMLLGAGWIAWKRTRSAHHAGFMTILAILFVTFGILHFFPELHGS